MVGVGEVVKARTLGSTGLGSLKVGACIDACSHLLSASTASASHPFRSHPATVVRGGVSSRQDNHG